MIKEEIQECVILDRINKEHIAFSNRYLFHVLANYKENFKDQDECDNLLAKLIIAKKINPKRIYGDAGEFKPNKKLEKLITKIEL